MNLIFNTKWRKSRLRVTEATLGNLVDMEATFPFNDVCIWKATKSGSAPFFWVFKLVSPLPFADVNKNDFQDKFAGYGFYRFPNLPA